MNIIKARRLYFGIGTGLTIIIIYYINIINNFQTFLVNLARQPPNNGSRSGPYPVSEEPPGNCSTPLPIKRTYEDPLTILLWTTIPGRHSPFDDLPDTYYSDQELNCAALMPYRNFDGRCFFTYNRDLAEKADVIFFAMQEYMKTEPIPQKRNPNQYWVFFDHEAPPQLYHFDWKVSQSQPKKLQKLKSAFNWTMSYRLDSTIPAPYGRFERLETPDFSRNYDRLTNKTVQALYMASYCGNRMSHRDEFVQELVKAGLDVEIIGCDIVKKKSPLAGDPACKRTTVWSTKDECTEKIGQRYKFYLSFENSLCQDYVTEKFYRAVTADLIPVVLNGANMSLIAPEHSYIDVKDFKSPRELAVFLNKIAADPKLYNSYFWWKPYYNVFHTFEGMLYKIPYCELCSYALRNLARPCPAQIDDIEDWWVKKGNCYEGAKQWLK